MNKLPFEKRKSKILVKKKVDSKVESEGELGSVIKQRPIKRLLDLGVINIDKPAGPTSHNVAHYVKQILKCDKAGHAGTLDPKVTGCLPVAIGRATRVLQAVSRMPKEYICVMHLHKELGDEKETKRLVRVTLKKFVGKIKQVPPVKSSVKRVEREREIYYIKLLEIKDKDVLFIVGCEAGTYVRKICTAIGEDLGIGAHMKELRRTKAGVFGESTLVTLNTLRDTFLAYQDCSSNIEKEKKKKSKEAEKYEAKLRKYIQPPEVLVKHLPKIWVLDQERRFLKHGRNLFCKGISRLDNDVKKDSKTAIMGLRGELLALGTAMLDANNIMTGSGLAVNIEKVFV